MGVKPCSSAKVAAQAIFSESTKLPFLSKGAMIFGYAESEIKAKKVSMNSISESTISFMLKFVKG